MGGTLSCAGRGHAPEGEDTQPYSPVLKTNGVAPVETNIHTDDAEITYNNNNNNKNNHVQRTPSWKFWQRLSVRKADKDRSKTFDHMAACPEEGKAGAETLPDVVGNKGIFRRSWSLKPPPKPPRLFLFRSSTINTPRSSMVGETDRNSFIQSKAYKRGSNGAEFSKKDVLTENVETVAKASVQPASEPQSSLFVSKQDSLSNTAVANCDKQPTTSSVVQSSSMVVKRVQPRSPTGRIKIVSPDFTRKAYTRPRKKSGEITAEDRHVLIMQSASELLCQKLDPFIILEDLSKGNILSKEDLTAYHGHPDRRLICENIIQAVIDKEYSTFLAFCDVLRSITDYKSVASVLDAMRGVYDVIYEIPASTGDGSPILDDEKTISFDVVYYSLESGKIRSVVELEKSRNVENKRFSRDLLSYKRSSRLSFHSISSEVSSIFSEDIITTGIPMVTVAIAGHSMNGRKAEGIANVLENHSCILELHVGKTHLKGSDMQHIAKALHCTPALRVLDLRLNSLGNEGAMLLAAVLHQKDTLRQLNISSTGIDAEGCKHIADSLRVNVGLTELDMSFLDIGDSGCMVLGDALKQNRTLKKLRLRSDNISWIGCGFLFEGLEQGKSVVELDLSRNFIGDDGAQMVCRHLDDNSSLRELNLENCGFTSSSCALLADIILTNKSLSHLDLSVNFLGDLGVTKLSTALERNKCIRTLGLNMCGITNDGFSKLLDILEINPTLTLLKLCYNRLGREHTNPDATSDDLKYRIRIVTSSNPKLKLLLWGNTFEDALPSSLVRDINVTI